MCMCVCLCLLSHPPAGVGHQLDGGIKAGAGGCTLLELCCCSCSVASHHVCSEVLLELLRSSPSEPEQGLPERVAAFDLNKDGGSDLDSTVC